MPSWLALTATVAAPARADHYYDSDGCNRGSGYYGDRYSGDRYYGQSYSESSDQPALTAIFDMNAARRADSFDKCYREIVRLLNLLRDPTAT